MIWKIPAAGAILALSFLAAFLLIDERETLIEPDIDVLAPLPDLGEESYALLKSLCSGLELSPKLERRKHDLKDLEFGSEAHRKHLLDIEESLLADWKRFEPRLFLLHELAQYPQIGDAFVLSAADEDLLDVNGLLNLAALICFKAEYAAVFSRGSKFPLLRDTGAILQNWLPHVRTLLHHMVAIDSIRRVWTTADRLRPALAHAEWTSFARLLDSPPDPTDSLVRVLRAEYASMATHLESLAAEQSGIITNRLFFHPNRTRNAILRIYEAAITHVEAHDVDALGRHWRGVKDEVEGRSILNALGNIPIRLAVGAYDSLLEEIIQEHQQLEPLRQRLLPSDL
ncbi:MAG: hypothetical protein JJU00_02415 [Opitutales bacterium]|nr:hypothetical protein [Opitutales bacterium]